MRTSTSTRAVAPTTPSSIDAFVGVDPGARGAIAVLLNERPVVVHALVDCPLGDDDKPDERVIVELVRGIIDGRRVVGAVEKIQTFGKGKRRFGLEKLAANAATWRSALIACGVRIIEPLPQTWMKPYVGSHMFGEKLRRQRFAALRRQAMLEFPAVATRIEERIGKRLNTYNDRACGLLLADFARRRFKMFGEGEFK